MCQNMVTLAERGRARYISQCEHGTVHLMWDGVGFHLPAGAFVRMANTILQTRTVVEAQHAPTDQAHCRLQVNRFFVLLPIHEFLPLAGMVDEALGRVRVKGGLPRCVDAEAVQVLKLPLTHSLSCPINLN